MTVKVRGIERLRANSRRALQLLTGRSRDEALLEAAEVIQRDADAKVGGGVVAERKRDGVVGVGPDKDHWYLRFQELGAAPHTVKAKKAQVLADGQTVFGRQVQHPGRVADPFLRPAFDSQRDAAIRRYIQVSRSFLRRILP